MKTVNTNQIQQIFIFLIAISIWLLINNYTGIRHDALLYTVEALSINEPSTFKNDLFLAYGSQGSFTIFPLLYAKLIKIVGLDHAALLLTILGKILWLLSLLSVAIKLNKNNINFWAWPAFLVLTLPAFYDSHHVFSYAESFATPRIYAEALSLLSITLLLNRNFIFALLAALCALSLHPLMAIPTFLLLTTFVLLERKLSLKHLSIIALAIVINYLILTTLDIPFLSRLTNQYDPEWFAAIQLRNHNVFLSNWDTASFGKIIFIANIFILALTLQEYIIKRVALASLITLLFSLSLAYIGSDIWHNILITQLQMWRSLWLVQIIAFSILPIIICHLWFKSKTLRMVAMLMILAILLNGLSAAMLSLVSLLITVYHRTIELYFTKRVFLANTLLYIPILIAMPIIFFSLMMVINLHEPIKIIISALKEPAIILLVALLIYSTKNKINNKYLLSTSIILIVFSAYYWNQQLKTNNTNTKTVIESIKNSIPAGSIILSTQGIEQTWLTFGRASYASSIQTAGSLFTRTTAIEGIRRLKRMEQANFPDATVNWDNKQSADQSFTLKNVDFLCQDELLNYIVAPNKVNNNKPFTIYSCQEKRVPNHE